MNEIQFLKKYLFSILQYSPFVERKIKNSPIEIHLAVCPPSGVKSHNDPKVVTLLKGFLKLAR